ncbi:MAG: SDR family oxidoreductase [Opitutaceae bacterium]|nr:SDR family oxidoreductase [Opitutaceae bacterium]
MNTPSLFAIAGKVIVVTGATGTLTGSAAKYLAGQGARVVYLGRTQSKLDATLTEVRKELPDAEVLAVAADVNDRAALEHARDTVVARWGRVDALLNGAGGNQPGATLTPDKTFTDLDFSAFRQVVDLNLHGTVLPTLVFTPALQASPAASIVNYSSASASRAITRVIGYSAAKAAVENFTRWLAVEFARKSKGTMRVNALVPGFFLGEQNRRLLTNEDGTLTARGETIIRQTPFGRFGQADELHGAIHYLVSDASKFVTGTTLVVDGGFGVFSGV